MRSEHMLPHPDIPLAGRTITVRRTQNPFVPNPQYIAYSKVTLDYRGWLDMTNLNVGESDPEVYFRLAMRPGRRGFGCPIWGATDGFLPSCVVAEALSYGPDNAVTVIALSDFHTAWAVEVFGSEYEKSERRKEYWANVAGKVWKPVEWIVSAGLGLDIPGSASPSAALATPDAPIQLPGTDIETLVDGVGEEGGGRGLGVDEASASMVRVAESGLRYRRPGRRVGLGGGRDGSGDSSGDDIVDA